MMMMMMMMIIIIIIIITVNAKFRSDTAVCKVSLLDQEV
jgi:hypothetical protein